MLWKYRIKTSSGDFKEGDLRADSYQLAVAELTKGGHQVLSLRKTTEIAAPSPSNTAGQAVRESVGTIEEFEEVRWTWGWPDLLSLALAAGVAFSMASGPQYWGPLPPASAGAQQYHLTVRGQLDLPAQNQSMSSRTRLDILFPEIDTAVCNNLRIEESGKSFTCDFQLWTPQIPTKCTIEISKRGFVPSRLTFPLHGSELELGKIPMAVATNSTSISSSNSRAASER